MPEEGTHESWVSSNLSKLLVDSRTQLFAFLQRASRNACALDVTPHQLIRIEVWRDNPAVHTTVAEPQAASRLQAVLTLIGQHKEKWALPANV